AGVDAAAVRAVGAPGGALVGARGAVGRDARGLTDVARTAAAAARGDPGRGAAVRPGAARARATRGGRRDGRRLRARPGGVWRGRARAPPPRARAGRT